MKYYTEWFEEVEDLKNFLNERGIQPSNIIQIYKDQYFHYLIYIK